jgi:hypothetical protein
VTIDSPALAMQYSPRFTLATVAEIDETLMMVASNEAVFSRPESFQHCSQINPKPVN